MLDEQEEEGEEGVAEEELEEDDGALDPELRPEGPIGGLCVYGAFLCV